MKQITALFLILFYILHIGIVFSQEIVSPEYLYFLDKNSNNKIDSLQIDFSDVLSGTLNTEKLFLYSASGGLSGNKIDGLSGNQIFSGYTLSGHSLTLLLHEQDLEGTRLLINNTTSSHLRLKTNAGVGLYDTSGNEIKLLYTSSFDNYKKVSFKESQENIGILPIENPGDTQSGSLTDSGTLVLSGSLELPEDQFIQTGTLVSSGTLTSSGIIESSGSLISTGIVQSETILQAFTGKVLFQNPTYFTDKTENLSEYHCLTTQTDCKVNYNLEINSGSGFTSISSTKYNCEWDFGFGEFLDEKYKCNPNTITYPEGTFETTYTITEIVHPENYYQQKIKIVNNGYIAPKPVIKTIYHTIEKQKENLYISSPEIEIQSGIDAEGNCFKDPCKINLKYTQKNSQEMCLWQFPGGSYDDEIHTKCNPGYVSYGYGDYEIRLRVYEKGNSTNFQETKLFFSHQKKLVGEKPIIKDDLEEVFDMTQKEKTIDYSGLKIIGVFPNPSGKDDREYIEIQNTSSGEINLKGCFLDDKIKSGSKPYLIETDEIFTPGEIKKYFKVRTNINLDNSTGDEVNIICQENIIDTFSWKFGVGDDVLLTEEHKDFTGEKLTISKQELKQQIFSLSSKDNITQDYIEIVNKNFTQKIKKQKKGVKIYGTTFPKTKVILEIIEVPEFSFFPKTYAENGFLELFSDEKGKYEILLPEVKIGEFEVKNYLGINEKTLLPLSTTSRFDVDSDYIEYVQFDTKKSKDILPKELKASITLQKLAKGISVTGNKITCQNMSECHINFDGRTSTGNIKKYFWDFGNGATSTKSNPTGVKFASGKHIVTLKVSDDIDEKESFFLIQVVPKVKANQAEIKNKTQNDTKTLGKITKIDIVSQEKKTLPDESNFQKDLFMSIFIGVLFLLGGAIILKREQII